MRELAVQSANDTLTSTERNYTNSEFQALSSEIDRIASVTNYNRQELLSTTAGRFGLNTGGSSGSVLWVDANHTVGTDSITITIDTLTTGAINMGLRRGGGSGKHAVPHEPTRVGQCDQRIGQRNQQREHDAF